MKIFFQYFFPSEWQKRSMQSSSALKNHINGIFFCVCEINERHKKLFYWKII